MTVSSHVMGFLGGAMWCVGTLLAFVAGDTLGLTISMSITRCCPLVASLWGFALWGELKGASWKTSFLFVGMLVTYTSAVALISMSG